MMRNMAHCRQFATMLLCFMLWARIFTGCAGAPTLQEERTGMPTPSAHVAGFIGEAIGGSNYAWFHVDCPSQPCPPTGKNCREPYGVVANYHHHAALLRDQLEAMYAAGQRRLRIPIFHMHGQNTGTVMDSQGGTLSEQHRQNLRDLLKDIRDIGYEAVIIGFFPIGPYNTPFEWTTWREEAYQENWGLIVDLRPIVVDAGIPYLFDLMNEGAPQPSQTQLRAYVGRLWRDYAEAFGTEDTVGFSIIGDSPARYQTLASILDSTGYGRPTAYELHFYEDISTNFQRMDAAMVAQGDHRPWIIGETFYNDAISAQALARLSSRRRILYILQWPITRNRGCDGHCDVAPPKAFDHWLLEQ